MRFHNGQFAYGKHSPQDRNPFFTVTSQMKPVLPKLGNLLSSEEAQSSAIRVEPLMQLPDRFLASFEDAMIS